MPNILLTKTPRHLQRGSERPSVNLYLSGQRVTLLQVGLAIIAREVQFLDRGKVDDTANRNPIPDAANIDTENIPSVHVARCIVERVRIKALFRL
jgi:hypothetical protein